MTDTARRWRSVAGFLAVNAALMAGWYAIAMAHLRSLPPVFRWDSGTVVELLVPFGVALVFANVSVVVILNGLRSEQDSRGAAAVRILGAIAAFAVALFFLAQAVFILFPQY